MFQGGLPRGRFVEVYGDFSTLKSYIGLASIAKTQADGGVAVLIDVEHTFDPKWAASIGVNTEELILQQPATGEQAIDVAEEFIRNHVELVVYDSIAATLPQSERKDAMVGKTSQPGRIADLMSRACRKLTAANSTTSVLWINQLRQSIGVTFGPTEHPTGGKSMGYYASMRMAVKKTGRLTEPTKTFDGDTWVDSKLLVAQKYKATMDKSKLNQPHREVHFVWDLRTGSIDLTLFLMSHGLELGIITRPNKQMWCYGKTKVRGTDAFKAKLAKDDALRLAIENEVRSHYGLPVVKSAAKTIVTTKAITPRRMMKRR